MKCMICGKEYKHLGIHVQKAHMSCDEYRRKFNIPLLLPLVDPEISERLSNKMLERLTNPAFRKEAIKQCKKNGGVIKGTKRGTLRLPKISSERIAATQKKTAEYYKRRKIPDILADYKNGLTPTEIVRKHGVAAQTLKNWEAAGLLPLRRLTYVLEELKK